MFSVDRDDTKSQVSHDSEAQNIMTSSMTLPSRAARLAEEEPPALDKSLSQPNVAIRETDILGTDADILSPPPTPRSSAEVGKGEETGESVAVSPSPGDISITATNVSGNHADDGVGGSTGAVLRVHNTTTSSTSDLSPIQELQEKAGTGTPQKSASPSISPNSTLTESMKSLMSSSLVSASILSQVSKNSSKDPHRNGGSVRSVDSGTGVSLGLSTSHSTPDTTSDDLSVDIDTALEEVMAGLKSLEMQQKQDKRMSLPAVKVKQTPKHTPDLVIDLPDGNGNNSSTDSAEPDSPTNGISAAETFAQSHSNQGTLKKMSGEETTPQRGMGVLRSMSCDESPGSRLSISSEPGDLTRNRDMRDTFGKPTTMMSSSQSPMSTFNISSLKRTQSLSQSVSPIAGRPVDSHALQTSSPKMSSSFSPITVPSVPTPPVFIPPVPKLQGPSVGPPNPLSGSPLPPPVAQKPKPPLKVRPPVMKKPATPPRQDLTGSPTVCPPPP